MTDAVRVAPRESIASSHLRIRVGCYEAVISTADVALASLSALASHIISIALVKSSYGFHSPASAACIGLVTGLLYLTFGRSAELYTLPSWIGPKAQLAKVVVCITYSVLLIAAVLFIVRAGPNVSRTTFLVFVPLVTTLLVANRLVARALAKTLVTRARLTGPSVVVLGDRSELAAAGTLLNDFGVREVGRIAFDTSEPIDEPRIKAMLDLARSTGAERFVVMVKWDADGKIAALRDALRRSALPATMLPDFSVRKLYDDRLGHSVAGRLPVIELQRAPMALATRFAKRAMDVVGASIALVVLSPLLLFTAIAIKLDSPGPIIFCQRRHGYDRDPFRIYKFRSMRVAEDGPQIAQACKGDARITRVGRAIRKTSIDELPQLLNVLIGNMSLVGPRPHAVAHDDEYGRLIDRYANRHHVKPGVTGWAQINGARGQTAAVEQMQRRVDLDLWYIDNCSILLDIAILFRTCWEVVKSDAV